MDDYTMLDYAIDYPLSFLLFVVIMGILLLMVLVPLLTEKNEGK